MPPAVEAWSLNHWTTRCSDQVLKYAASVPLGLAASHLEYNTLPVHLISDFSSFKVFCKCHSSLKICFIRCWKGCPTFYSPLLYSFYSMHHGYFGINIIVSLKIGMFKKFIWYHGSPYTSNKILSLLCIKAHMIWLLPASLMAYEMIVSPQYTPA